MTDLPNPFDEIRGTAPAPRPAAVMPLFRWCEGCPHPELCSQFKMCRQPRHVTPLPALIMHASPAPEAPPRRKRAAPTKKAKAKTKGRRR